MLYFAYGSNLSPLRLKQRVPSASLVTTGQLSQHRLLFHKVGRDGSAKCDAFFTGHVDDILYGALYLIDPEQKQFLDQAEGLGNGYEIKEVTISAGPEGTVSAFTYYATRVAEDIMPFHWYMEHVLAGAREHCFPQQYIDRIAGVSAVEDTDTERANREMGIYTGRR